MATIREHLKSWGVPAKYARDYDLSFSSLDSHLAPLCRAVSNAANWYDEQDACLVAMVLEDDTAALREWAESGAFEEISEETGGGEDDGGLYGQDIREAFDELIEAIEASKTTEQE